MLKSITINNYKTFIKSSTFDFTASKYTFLEKTNVGSDKVLKGALFVGENASGKTNVLKAILFLIQTFVGINTVDFFDMKSLYTNEKTFSIEYTFVVNGIDVNYKIICDLNGFKEEILKLDKDTYFVRKGKVASIVKAGKFVDANLDLSDNIPFLRTLFFNTGFSDSRILVKWANELQNSIYINCLDCRIEGSQSIIDAIANNKYIDENGTDSINSFLKEINYKQKIYYSNIVHNKTVSFNNPKRKFISFEKEDTNIKIPIKYESTGNLALIPILLTIIHAINTNCMLIIDEFSSGLHNELEECLLKYFFVKSKNSQIFFVTHSTNVLKTDLLRPDQVYSMRFDGKNGSVFTRFSDRDPMPRVAQNLEHMYLNGVFNGKPCYNSNFKS